MSEEDPVEVLTEAVGSAIGWGVVHGVRNSPDYDRWNAALAEVKPGIPYDQYEAVLDERDEAIARAEKAEAQLARFTRWVKLPLLILLGMTMLTITALLFLVVVYAGASILGM